MIKQVLFVGFGGAAGSILRYLIQRYTNVPGLPYGTLLVNLAGCFLIGLFWGLLSKNTITPITGILLMTGFCGGFTTFSAFTFEGLQMMEGHRWLLLTSYIGASVIGGLFATFAGYKLTS